MMIARRRGKTNQSEARKYLQSDPDYLVKLFISKEVGHGVFTNRTIQKGQILCEYKGELLTEKEGEEREFTANGNFLFFFTSGNKDYCIDATNSTCICKYVNDSPKKYTNAVMKAIQIDMVPHLLLYATKNICCNTEIRYDYCASNLWWRQNKSFHKPLTMNASGSMESLENGGQEIPDPQEGVSCSADVTAVMRDFCVEQSVMETCTEPEKIGPSPDKITYRKENDPNEDVVMSRDFCDESPTTEASTFLKNGGPSNQEITDPQEVVPCSADVTAVIQNLCNEVKQSVTFMETSEKVGPSPDQVTCLKKNNPKDVVVMSKDFCDEIPTMETFTFLENKGSTMGFTDPKDVAAVIKDLCEEVVKSTTTENYTDLDKVGLCIERVTDLKGDAMFKDSCDEAVQLKGVCAGAINLDLPLFPEMEDDESTSSEPINFESDFSSSNSTIIYGFERSDSPHILKPLLEQAREIKKVLHLQCSDIEDSDDQPCDIQDPLGIFGLYNEHDTPKDRPAVDPMLHANGKIDFQVSGIPEQLDVSDDSALQLDEDLEVLNSDQSYVTQSPEVTTKKKKKWKIRHFIKKKRKRCKFLESDRESSSPHKMKTPMIASKMVKSKKKPHRPCLFCGKLTSAISRHLQTVHKKEPQIQEALLKPRKERLAMLDSLKKEGIKTYNQKLLKENDPSLHRERSSKSSSDKNKILMCSKCHGFYASTYFFRHKKHCSAESCLPDGITVSLLDTKFTQDLNKDYVSKVLSKLRDDKIGQYVRKDQTLLMFGSHTYEKVKRKTSKKTEVRRSVRSDLRKLATLYLQVKEQPITEIYNDVRDMLRRENFIALKKAVEITTTKDDDSLKASLKTATYYLLKQLAKHSKGNFLLENKDSEAENINNFMCILDMSKEIIFGDASYMTHQRRQRKLRRPEALPLEDDLSRLRHHILSRVKQICAFPDLPLDPSVYVELRNCLIARLTLFNARRGGEPARLLLTEWEDALQNAWIDQSRCEKIEDPLDLKLLNDIKITYQMGKGNYKLVPVLMPNDTIDGLKILADHDKRKAAGVSENNNYLFPATQQSENNASGWHAIDYLCGKIEIKSKELITATKQRHRVSTIFASFDLPAAEREAFFEHMGHSQDINTNIYQAPPALKEVMVVGKHLVDIDKSNNIHNEPANNGEIVSEEITESRPVQSSQLESSDSMSYKNTNPRPKSRMQEDKEVPNSMSYKNNNPRPKIRMQEDKEVPNSMSYENTNPRPKRRMQEDKESPNSMPNTKHAKRRTQEDKESSNSKKYKLRAKYQKVAAVDPEITDDMEDIDDTSEDENFEPSEDQPDDESLDDENIAVEQPIKRGGGRPRKHTVSDRTLNPTTTCENKNFIWRTEDTEALLSVFKEFIYRTSDRSMPAKSMVLQFMNERKLQLPYDKVRTKIVNERTKTDKLCSRRMEMLHM